MVISFKPSNPQLFSSSDRIPQFDGTSSSSSPGSTNVGTIRFPVNRFSTDSEEDESDSDVSPHTTVNLSHITLVATHHTS